MGDLYLEAAVFLDNTSGKTAAAGGGNKSVDGNNWFGYVFQTPTEFSATNFGGDYNWFSNASGMFCTTSSSGNYTVDVRLYSATHATGSLYKPDTLIGSTTATLSNVTTTPTYYDINLPTAGWNTDWKVQEGNNYYAFVIGNGTYVDGGEDKEIKWAGIDSAEPASGGAYGLIDSNWVSSGNGGSGWSSANPSDRPALYLTGPTPSVPEPHEYALMAGLGLIGFGIWRRRMRGTTSASA